MLGISKWSVPALVALACLPESAWADPTQLSCSDALSMTYDSNPSMSHDDPKGNWSAAMVPGLSLLREMGRDRFSAGLSLNLEHSWDNSVSRDRADPDISVAWRRDDPTGGFGITTGYQTASTRQTEFTDTGLVYADRTRSTGSLAASYDRQLSSRLGLGVHVGYSQVDYSGSSPDSGSGSLVGYSTLSWDASLTRAIDAAISGFAKLAVNDYMSSRGSDSRSYSGLVGVSMVHGERLTGSFSIGVNRLSSTGKTGFIGDVNLGYEASERSHLSMRFEHAVSPSGEGGFSKTDSLQGQWDHALSERRSMSAQYTWFNSASGSKSQTRQLMLSFSNQLDDCWLLRASYTNRSIAQPGFGQARGNQFMVALVYSNPNLH